ncbi:MAG: ornithine carbamoyltransferase [Thermodesulfobacteria bacterium]|nr:ornithine carbamoyltransferase [Thermodesulfobacteriota bacterium]
MDKKVRHYLQVADLDRQSLLGLIERAIELKEMRKKGIDYMPATGKVVGMLFEKASTRTRISFEAAMYQLGGSVSFMAKRDLQLDRGEPLADTARVLARYLDCLVVRTYGQHIVEELAKWSDIPVINGLTDAHHPCQILSDIMTVIEHKGSDLASLKVAWVGDGNNMAHSWIQAASRMGFPLYLACPAGYYPDEEILAKARAEASYPIEVTEDPVEAVRDADVINTDVWASMGQEDEALERKKVFEPYQLNEDLLKHAKADCIVLHCLPAHKGEEITEEVLEGPKSVVWDQAENKMHIHKAVLEWAMNLRD